MMGSFKQKHQAEVGFWGKSHVLTRNHPGKPKANLGSKCGPNVMLSPAFMLLCASLYNVTITSYFLILIQLKIFPPENNQTQ